MVKSKGVRYISPLRYPGGKSRAANFLLGKFPEKFEEYREPFVGGGSVFFALKSRDVNSGTDRSYWLNDKFPPIAWFWDMCQNTISNKLLTDELESLYRICYNSDTAAFCKRLGIRYQRELGATILRDWTCEGGLDWGRFTIEESEEMFRGALLAFFLNRNTFSGTILEGGFSENASLERWTVSCIERLKPMSNALEGARISCLDFSPVVSAPGDNAFLFLDPPYYTTKGLYTLHRMNHELLASLLKETKHKFVLTYDDCEEIRDLYDWAVVEEFNIQYGMDNLKGKSASNKKELLIRNY